MNESVFIIGAGSIGSFLKQRLERHGQIQMLSRASVQTLDSLFPGALVFLTPKCIDLKACIQQLGNPPAASESHPTVYVFIQNGLGICEEFAPRSWWSRTDVALVRATLWLGARLDRATGELYTTDVESIEVAGASAGVDRVATFLESAGLPVKKGQSIEETEWKKAYWNVSLNALAAVAGVVNQEVLDRADLRAKFEALLEEAAQVARACDVVLTEADRARVIAATRKVGSNRNSMLQDLEAGRVTELRWLNERLIEWGQKNGVSTVNHEEIVREIHLKASFRHH